MSMLSRELTTDVVASASLSGRSDGRDLLWLPMPPEASHEGNG